MKKLSEKEMIQIIRQGRISACTKEEKAQVMAFAFGEEYVKQNDSLKGSIQTYQQ